MRKVTGLEPKMFGPSIVGFGEYAYRYESGRSGTAPAAGFSPRKAATVIYLLDGVEAHAAALEKLGPHTAGVGCLNIKDLTKIDLDVLRRIVRASFGALTRGTVGKRARDQAPEKATSKGGKKPPKDQKKPRVFAIPFASVYPLYLEKAGKKGRTKQEVDEIIAWLTGYAGKARERAIRDKVDLETFFAQAPRMNPNAALIKGVVCGVRVEDVADPLMQKIRYLDKLIDELAKGKKLESILRRQ
jgi:hypothetical protein